MTEDERDAGSTARVADRLRDMIITGRISPGQQIRQERMAVDLGVSRAPLREALKQLASEGLIGHRHNTGYHVIRYNRDQFEQIYRMRRLLETDVIRSMPAVDASVIEELAHLNELVAEASREMDLPLMQKRNHEFHFLMFRQSGLDLMVAEIERLWLWAMPYHLVYLYDSAGRERSVCEHESMLDALRARDNEKLAVLMDEHRLASDRHTSIRFGAATVVNPLD